MSAGPDVEAVLSQHQPEDIADHYCACSDYRLDVPWTAHVAAVLREHIGAWLNSEAAVQSVSQELREHHGFSEMPDDECDCCAKTALSTLAAQLKAGGSNV